MNSKDLFNTPEWKEFQEAQTSWEQEFEASSEALWNSFSKEDQLKIFCAVVRRIYKAELEDKGTYRYALYDVFEFGPESYASAQLSGYLALHNAIFDQSILLEIEDKIVKFAQENNVDSEKTKSFINDLIYF
jgi:hypothetical protein